MKPYPVCREARKWEENLLKNLEKFEEKVIRPVKEGNLTAVLKKRGKSRIIGRIEEKGKATRAVKINKNDEVDLRQA